MTTWDKRTYKQNEEDLKTASPHLTSVGGKVDKFALDKSTGAQITITYPHHEVHSGSSFRASHFAAGGSGTKATISFTTADTDKWLHVIFTSRSNVEAIFTFGEGATVTGSSGSDYAPRNRNRNSTKTSGVSGAGSAGAAGNCTVGGTVTDFGTILEQLHFGSGVKVGGDTRGTAEWVLAPNTVYAVEIESQAASSEVFVDADWYEHSDKQ